ncbi:MAG: GTP-binding protein [bacterium]|nr:GTP-binding protein [bacterium]
MRTPIPVTVLVGFLGGGKTTLLNRILTQAERKFAVIVNDFAALGIDAKLVSRREEQLVELSNGCICCTLRGDLLEELKRLSDTPDIDYILIESTGLGEPLPIAQTFYMDDLQQRVRLDNLVSVIDAANFWRYYESELPDENDPDETIALAPLLADQIEFANTIILNKVDLVASEAVDALEAFARQLNPSARIVRAQYGNVPLSELLDTQRYDYERGFEHPDWEEEWHKTGSESEEYGFSSFVYGSSRPFVWERFEAMLHRWHPSIVRCKGLAIFADHDPVILQQAGAHVALDILDFSDVPTDAPALPSSADEEAFGGCFINPITQYGDADPDTLTTELVFIGRNMPEATIRQQLDACLIG